MADNPLNSEEPEQINAPREEDTAASEVSNGASMSGAPLSRDPALIADFRARVVAGKQRKLEFKLEKLTALAHEKKVLKTGDIQLLLHVSDPTATRYARLLIKRGVLRAVGKTKGLHYEVVE